MAAAAAIYLAGKSSRDETAQFARLVAEIDRILAAEANADRKPLDMTIHTTGDAAVLETIVKASAFRTRAAVLAYRATMKELDYPGFIEPERLAKAGGPADAAQRIAQVHAAYQTLHERLIGERDGLRRALAAAAVPDAVKGPLLSAFDRRIAADGPKFGALLADETALFGEVAAMVKDLRHSKAHWSAKGRHMQFYDQGDLDRYNAHAARLRALEGKISGDRRALRPSTH
jgi:hypothetical protein